MQTIWETPNYCKFCGEHLSEEWLCCPTCGESQYPDKWTDAMTSIHADNTRLQAELTSLRSENAMLRKMQPVTLNGDAARSFALAAELSEAKQALAALRADIEAGRLVRVPCKRGDTVWAVRSYRDFKHPQQGVVSEMYFNPDMKLHVIVKHVARGELGKTVFLTHDEAEQAARAATAPISDPCLLCGTQQLCDGCEAKDRYEAARAAKEDGNG
jgi:RNA polymerase subunit RPABC4/transcription elongation factor Spt4